MSTLEVWISILGLMVITFLTRGFFLLMIYNLPLRRTILQSALRFLIEALTFIFCFCTPAVKLFISEIDPAACQVVRRQFHPHFVTRQNPDVVHAHFSGDRSQDLMPIFQPDAKHGIGEGLQNDAILLDQGLFGHMKLGVQRYRQAPEKRS